MAANVTIIPTPVTCPCGTKIQLLGSIHIVGVTADGAVEAQISVDAKPLERHISERHG
jgi:hypothetical protein